MKRALHILAQRNNNNSINQEPIKEQHVRISPKRNQAELDDQDEEKRGDGKEQDKENAGDDKEKDNENPGDDK